MFSCYSCCAPYHAKTQVTVFLANPKTLHQASILSSVGWSRCLCKRIVRSSAAVEAAPSVSGFDRGEFAKASLCEMRDPNFTSRSWERYVKNLSVQETPHEEPSSALCHWLPGPQPMFGPKNKEMAFWKPCSRPLVGLWSKIQNFNGSVLNNALTSAITNECSITLKPGALNSHLNFSRPFMYDRKPIAVRTPHCEEKVPLRGV